jgi:DUF1707 SHOCT-like domain
MDDRIRISDSDRDRVTARLRDHYAEGRLTPDELDERVTATLNAKTFGDLRQVMKDLPQSPAPPHAEQPTPAVPPGAGPRGPMPPWAGPGQWAPWAMRRRRVRILPLILLLVLVVVLVPGAGFVFSLVFKMILVFWLVAMLAGLFVAARFGWRIRRALHSDYWPPAWHGSYRRRGRRW